MVFNKYWLKLVFACLTIFYTSFLVGASEQIAKEELKDILSWPTDAFVRLWNRYLDSLNATDKAGIKEYANEWLDKYASRYAYLVNRNFNHSLYGLDLKILQCAVYYNQVDW